ncbi:hypothetical protein GCM10010191_73480 [Actinomadura vinacea]|uniref:JmjC domain-containing protein n=1 Tax=Actinomadura vinacea TaxID=115336 RepID=A0ABN3K406_9ACTN
MTETPPRVPAPSAEEFLNRYVRRGRPAVFTRLFQGQPIHDFRTRDAALERLGDLPITVTEPYHAGGFAAFRPDAPPPRAVRTTLAGYFQDDSPLLCLEQPTPPELRRTFDVPGYRRALGGEPCDGWESRLFAGHKGKVSNLHFDADFRGVLLHQVFGVKRLVWVPPAQSAKLLPFMNLSLLLPGRLTEDDRREWLGYVHAAECVLLPGDTAFIPTAYWHHAEYVEDSLSVNLRLPRNPFTRAIGGRDVHKTWRLGCVAASSPDPTAMTGADRADLDLVRRTLRHPGTPRERLDLMEETIRTLYERRCPGLPAQAYADTSRALDEETVWTRLIDEGVLYGP